MKLALLLGGARGAQVGQGEFDREFLRRSELMRLSCPMFVPGEGHGRVVRVEPHALAGDGDVVVRLEDDAAGRSVDGDLAGALDRGFADVADRIASGALVEAAANVERGVAGGLDGEGLAFEGNVLLCGDLEGDGREGEDRALVGEAEGEDDLAVGGSDLDVLLAALLGDLDGAARGEGDRAGRGVGGEIRGGGGREGCGLCAFFGVVLHGGMITERGVEVA